MLDPHLRRAKDVPGRVQRDAHSIEVDGLAVAHGANGGIGAEAMPHQRQRWLGTQVGGRAGAQMVTMSVGDHGTVHGRPGIDMEAAGFAEQAALGRGD